jgi:AcrR family transcriptional regulator
MQKWIEAGYEVFAMEGPEGVQIEKLARKIGVNKSGFYHHFGDRDVFFLKLIDYHYIRNEEFFKELSETQQFDPDVISLIVKYKSISFFQSQLRKHMDNPIYSSAFTKVKKRNEKAYVTRWSEYLKIDENPDLALELWDIVRDLYFIRLNNDKLNFESIQILVKEVYEIVQALKRHPVKKVTE